MKQENSRHDIEISAGLVSVPGFVLITTVGFDRITEMAALVVSSIDTQEVFEFAASEPVTFDIPTTGWYRLQSAAWVTREPGDNIILGVGICAGTPSFANLIAHKRRWMPSTAADQNVAISLCTEYYFTAGDVASLVAFSAVGGGYISGSVPIAASCRLIV